MCRVLVLPLALILCAAAPPPFSPAGAALARFHQAYQARHAALSRQLEAIQAQIDALDEQRMTQLVELVKKHPRDPGIFPALETLILDATPHAALALELITAHHLDHARLGRLCLFLIEADEGLGSKTEALARGAYEKSPHREVRAQAGLALARLLLARADAGTDRTLQGRQRREAEDILSNLLEHYPRVRLPHSSEEDDNRLMAAVVRPMLFDLRHLAVGRPIPDLRGLDDNGKMLSLADQRGQVVILVFWSATSGASAELFPRLKRLQTTHRGGRLVILGVMDNEFEVTREHRPEWRSFRDRGERGSSISGQWNLRSWPTLYLIDATGTIQGRWTGKPEDGVLEKQVADLLGRIKR